MTTEMPLHVQVAAVLGWTDLKPDLVIDGEMQYWGRPPADGTPFSAVERIVPRYDLDWSATGPLLERLSIDLNSDWIPARGGIDWRAKTVGRPYSPDILYAHAKTPLMAICALILGITAEELERRQ